MITFTLVLIADKESLDHGPALPFLVFKLLVDCSVIVAPKKCHLGHAKNVTKILREKMQNITKTLNGATFTMYKKCKGYFKKYL